VMVELCVNQVGPKASGRRHTAPDDPNYSGHIKAGRPRAPDREMQDSIYWACLPIITVRTVAIRATRRARQRFLPQSRTGTEPVSGWRERGEDPWADVSSRQFVGRFFMTV
jgi:hypothetical protein